MNLIYYLQLFSLWLYLNIALFLILDLLLVPKSKGQVSVHIEFHYQLDKMASGTLQELGEDNKSKEEMQPGNLKDTEISWFRCV